MQHLFRLAQNHLPNERRLLLPGVGTQSLEKRSLSVAEAQLDEVLADKRRVGIHGGLSDVEDGGRGGWVHVFDALSIELVAIAAKLISEAENASKGEDVADRGAEHAAVDVAEQQSSAADGEEDPGQDGVHELFPWALGDSLQLDGLAAALLQSDQRLPQLEAGVHVLAAGYLADRCLSTVAVRRDLRLAPAARLKV